MFLLKNLKFSIAFVPASSFVVFLTIKYLLCWVLGQLGDFSSYVVLYCTKVWKIQNVTVCLPDSPQGGIKIL